MVNLATMANQLTLEQPNPDNRRHAVVGVDVSTGYQDPTTIVIIADNPYQLVEHVSVPTSDRFVIAYMLMGLCSRYSQYRVSSIWVDAIGAKASFYDHLLSVGLPAKFLNLTHKDTEDVVLNLFEAIQRKKIKLARGFEGFRDIEFSALRRNQHAFSCAWHGITQPEETETA